MSFQICKFQLNEALFLKYQPSMVAASALIISVNIYELDREKNQPVGFFKDCMGSNSLLRMNTNIWNNRTVHDLTGYSVHDLQDCLYDLSIFIATNLQPNRLECFDIEAIKSLTLYV